MFRSGCFPLGNISKASFSPIVTGVSGWGLAYSHHDLETVEAFGLGALHFGGETFNQVFIHNTVRLGQNQQQNVRAELGLTAAKKARTCSMKYRSLSLSLFSQSWRSGARLISSDVQKLRELAGYLEITSRSETHLA